MSFLGLFNFSAPYLPWVLLAFSTLLGSSPLVDTLGIGAGHVYYFLEDVYPRMTARLPAYPRPTVPAYPATHAEGFPESSSRQQRCTAHCAPLRPASPGTAPQMCRVAASSRRLRSCGRSSQGTTPPRLRHCRGGSGWAGAGRSQAQVVMQQAQASRVWLGRGQGRQLQGQGRVGRREELLVGRWGGCLTWEGTREERQTDG